MKGELNSYDLWNLELNKTIIKIKVRTLLISFVVFFLILIGYALGSWEKHHGRERAQQFGYNSAILDYPGAGLAQSGVSFCFDQGNYYRVKKLGRIQYQISKDQSVPNFHKEK